MSAQIIDGEAFARKIIADVREKVAHLYAAQQIRPGLAAILVGDDPASQIYARNKCTKAHENGIYSEVYRLPANITQNELLKLIITLNEKPSIHAILVQLPLPVHIDSYAILRAILPEKDVDGFHPENVGRLWNGDAAIVPCTPLGCARILQTYIGDDLSGKHAVMIGASNIVGKPMSALLLQMNATVSILHSRSSDIAALTRLADIVIVAAGQPKLVKKSWVKPGAVILDVGISRIVIKGQEKIVGDVDIEDVCTVARAITPVPGGIGPVTVACLLQNTLNLALQHGNKCAAGDLV